MQIIAATNNKGKIEEIAAILGPLGITVIGQRDAGLMLEVEETGTTFEENALLKAEAAVQLSGLPALSDDSGLCVDALGGAPGVYSARYAGEHATDEACMQKLLLALRDVPMAERTAHFTSVVALVMPDGRRFTAEGRAEGHIALAPAGEGGFGYDPIFYCDARKKTYGEMTPEEKNARSHRFRALMRLKEILQEEL